MNAARNLGMTAVITLALVSAACTSSTVPPPKSSSSPLGSPATLVTATMTVSTADLSRFVALAHKGLPVETIPWRFTDGEAIAFSGQARVPVIRDGETVVFDSWSIAEHLEDHYPAPTLFGGATGRAHARFINAWADSALLGGIARLIVHDILRATDIAD